jgi:transcriptional regulator with GAF, ATPase, and Fis domain/CHASE2 domain-containing sensor protein
MNSKYIILITFVFCLFTIIPLPWDDFVNDSMVDLQFMIRGSREISEDLVVVFIGDEDLKSLGSWPISRDYYSYAIHILKSKGAKVIAFDILFAQRDKYHPEFDQTLVNFVKNSGNICLPMTFSELIQNNGFYQGINPTFPFEELKNSAAGIGFSNFGKIENVQSLPLYVFSQNELIRSFGSEMAKNFLDTKSIVQFNKGFSGINEDYSNAINQKGSIRLNHFGSIENVNSIGFVDLLQAYKNNPDSLNFNDKLVLITVTAAGVTNLKSTPFDNAFPSSLIHLTVAENLIYKKYLVESPLYLNLFILLLLVSGCVILMTNFKGKSIPYSFILLIVYWATAMLFFSYSNFILPLIYPSLAVISIIIVNQILTTRKKEQVDSVIKDMLQTQLDSKEKQLLDTKEQLNDLSIQLQQESESKEGIQIKAEENKNQVLQLEKEIRDLRLYKLSDTLKAKEIIDFENIIYSEKSKMADVLDLVSKVVSSDIPVLIYGDTGTGKEMIANAIHKKSNRKNAPFVALNCGALPENLLESELFGHEKGSFTGAVAMRKGKFELADGGVIFLDEISETSPTFQAKLLRVLQESTFERVGGEVSIKVNVRVIAATNRDLQVEIDAGRFRSDLFFRLNGFPISIPPLKERPEDIPLLAEYFLKKHGSNSSFSETAMQVVLDYSWPGNVRELENVVRRAAIMASSANRKLIQVEDIPNELKNDINNQNPDSIHKPIEDQIIDSLRLLKFSRSSISQTARSLGNKDRGTITEYFRGICFQIFTETNFDILKTAQIIAGTNDEEIINQVQVKLNEYLNNLKSFVADSVSIEFESISKGLPKKYHEYLRQVITYISKKSS